MLYAPNKTHTATQLNAAIARVKVFIYLKSEALS